VAKSTWGYKPGTGGDHCTPRTFQKEGVGTAEDVLMKGNWHSYNHQGLKESRLNHKLCEEKVLRSQVGALFLPPETGKQRAVKTYQKIETKESGKGLITQPLSF